MIVTIGEPSGDASVLAGIFSPDTGFRAVVTPFDELWAHLRDDMCAYVVPGLYVWEPIPFDAYQFLVETAMAAVNDHLAREGRNIRVWYGYGLSN